MGTPASAEVTGLLLAWGAGDKQALDQFVSSRPHAPGFGARQRSISEARGCSADALAESRALLRRGRWIDESHSGGLQAAALPDETAEVSKVSPDTVLRDWRLAKVWLHRELQKGATA